MGEENKNLEKEKTTTETGAADIREDGKQKVSLGRAIWNGTKWFVSKTWKFVAGGIAAIGIERVVEHFGGESDETENSNSTEETPAE